MELVNKKQLLKRFPKVEFAFYLNFINRHSTVYQRRNKPVIDMILAVDDVAEFHKENIAQNKSDYQFSVRFFKNMANRF